MMPALFFFLLLIPVNVSLAVNGTSDKVCSYQDVLNYLNLTRNNELFTMTRPVKDYTEPTEVDLEVLLYAILDVREIDQRFVPYVWIFASWHNDYIQWNPDDFCGIDSVSLPTELMWKPDLTIEETIEKDKSPPSPHLTISSNGSVNVVMDQVLVSTCRMHVYKFPFDIQKCRLTFKSVIHSVNDIRLVHHLNSSQSTEWSRDVMRTQYEWLFINMTVTNRTVDNFGMLQDVMIYTIRMKRRSILYIVNFLLPVLFFLCLDLASFLVSDSGGEKLSFKVTVLLAVTVMQLILNEILPSSSNKIPLIAVYCIGIFGMMMLSLLETILVMHLMAKDSSPQERETDRKQEGDESKRERKWTACIRDVSTDERPTALLKGSSSQLTEESRDFEKLSDELREVVKALALLLDSRKEGGKPGYWTRISRIINRVFFTCYVIAASLFLFFMFFHWND